MAFVKADRVQETSVTVGTGAFVLGGAYGSTFRTFTSQMSDGDTCQYLIFNENANNEWEIGEGTFTTASNSLSRDAILSSSNNDLIVTFTVGNKRVAMLPPASAMVVENNNGDATIERDLSITRDLSVGRNATVAGTLGVTGNTALGGGLDVVGTVTLDTALGVSSGGTGGTTSQTAAENLSVGYAVPTLAALKALTARPEVVIVETGQAKGVWQWELGSSTTADDALVVNPTSGTAGRYKRIYDGALYAVWFNVTADGSTDDTAALAAAIAAIPAAGGTLILPAGRIKISSTVTVGNGSNSAISTINSVTIQGAGCPSAYATVSDGTEIFWAGASGGTMLIYAGTADGLSLLDVELNCNSLADTGLQLYGLHQSEFRNINIREFTGIGLDLDTRTGPGGASNFGSNNIFQNVQVTSSDTSAVTGLRMGGYFAGPYDWHRNVFQSCIFQVANAGASTAYAADLEFCDSNTFSECDFSTYAGGTGFAIRFDAVGHASYPQNNFFYGCSISSIQTNESGGDVIGYNTFLPFCTADSEPVPTHAKLVGLTDQWKNIGGSPSVIDREIDAAFVSNTMTETTVFTHTVPANALRSILSLVYAGDGRILNNSGGNVNFRMRYYLGGSVFFDTGNISVPNDINIRATVLSARISAANATNAQRTTGRFTLGAANTVSGTAAVPTAEYVAGCDLSIDTTAAQEFKVTITMGTANPNAIYVARTGTLQIL